ncbi:MAG: hypothetical protein HC903_19165 [Methylacidiphilales bacterium]|nr:hypothetical protein [Candidatus Methylacidiphilales bacterium]
MNQFTSTLLLAGFFVSNSLVSSSSLAATPGIDLLKENTIKSFLQKANNPTTSLHKKLVELNLTDGRNSNGIFPKTLTIKDIQAILITGQDQFGSYCSALPGKATHFQCSNGVSETYLILIPSKIGVHKAVEYQKFQFIVEASKKVDWKKDEKDKEYDRKESIKISEPIQISIEKIVSDK